MVLLDLAAGGLTFCIIVEAMIMVNNEERKVIVDWKT
jgi:hypothetical protein